jgi:excisionase family DNA binding protein
MVSEARVWLRPQALSARKRGGADGPPEATNVSVYPVEDRAARPPRPALTRDDVMTAAEVADLLRMPLSTVYELARRGLIPAHRIGRRWRFIRREIEE